MYNDSPRRRRTATWKLATTTLLISITLSIVVAELFLHWYGKSIHHSSEMDHGLIRYHSILGWTLSSSWTGRHKHHDFDVGYSVNKLGIRETALSEAEGESEPKRIGLLGDSFTFGLGVDDGQTFASFMQRQNPDQKYFNLGFPGYSTDQQYLYLKYYARYFQLDHIVLLVYLGNDLLDNGLTFPLQANEGKPFFEVTTKGLELRNTPVPKNMAKPRELRAQTIGTIAFGEETISDTTLWARLRLKSQILQRLTPVPIVHSEAELSALLEKRLQPQRDLFTAILGRIVELTQKNGQSLSIAILPGKSFVYQIDKYALSYQDHVRKFLLAAGKEMKIPVVDVAGKMLIHKEKYPNSRIFHPNEGHFTSEGHRLVADVLLSGK